MTNSWSAVIRANGTDILTDVIVNTSGPVPGLPGYFVFFDSDRVRGSFGLMAPAGGKPTPMTPKDLKQHGVDLYNNGMLVQPMSIAQTQWWGGWSSKFTPDSIQTTPAQLQAANILPPFNMIDVIPPRTPQPSAGNPDFKPGGAYGISRFMPTTGERPDIGLFTDRQADAVLHNADALSFANLIEEAKGFDSMPIWQFSPVGKPWDMDVDYRAQTYGANQGGQYVVGQDVVFPSGSVYPSNRYSLDPGHNPRWPFLLYMMTGDTHYLRIGQFYTTHLMLGDNVWSVKAGYYVVTQGQDRSWGWTTADIIAVAIATRKEEQKCAALGIPFPADLHGFAYWKKILDNQAKWFTQAYVNDPDCARYGFAPNEGFLSPWQQDHATNASCWAALNFPAEWAAIPEFLARNLYPRCDGKSGWPVAMPSVYRLSLGSTFLTLPAWTPSSVGKVDDNLQYQGGWSEVWAELCKLAGTTAWNNITPAMIAALKADPTNKGNWLCWDKATPCFTHIGLAWLVYLQRLGILNIDAKYGIDLEAIYTLNHAYFAKQNTCAPRWSIMVPPKGTAVIPPPPVTPPPVVTPPVQPPVTPPPVTTPPVTQPPVLQPPAGTPPMTKFVQGTTYNLDLTLDGANYGVDFSATPAGQVNVSARTDTAGNIIGCAFTPVVDTTAEDFVVAAAVHVDPNDASKVLTATFSGTDVLKAATKATLSLSASTPIPTGG